MASASTGLKEVASNAPFQSCSALVPSGPINQVKIVEALAGRDQAPEVPGADLQHPAGHLESRECCLLHLGAV